MPGRSRWRRWRILESLEPRPGVDAGALGPRRSAASDAIGRRPDRQSRRLARRRAGDGRSRPTLTAMPDRSIEGGFELRIGWSGVQSSATADRRRALPLPGRRLRRFLSSSQFGADGRPRPRPARLSRGALAALPEDPPGPSRLRLFNAWDADRGRTAPAGQDIVAASSAAAPRGQRTPPRMPAELHTDARVAVRLSAGPSAADRGRLSPSRARRPLAAQTSAMPSEVRPPAARIRRPSAHYGGRDAADRGRARARLRRC